MPDVDLTLDTRQAIVAHLGPTLGGATVYGEFTAADVSWPFIRYESTSVPYEDSCKTGSTVTVSLHVFADGPSTDAVLILAKQVVARMATFTGADADYLGNIGPLADNPEATKWHVVVRYSVLNVE